MNRQEIDEELSQPGARTLLDTATLLRLAYSGPDGLPRVIPIGFLWTGDSVVVCTAVGAPKVAALRARPDVSLTIDVGDTPATAQAVLIRGIAQLEIVDGVPAEFIDSARKVVPEGQIAEYESGARAMYDRMVRISITPSWARYYDFGAGRMPRFLKEMAGA
jgi:nitroimidazol reductase NimA-like FMN-containing flavoprotein (pyridoxamine 5'-phosphate oxidase superfamily)